jgi:formate hydrogenlyase transcriptional activator
VATSDPAFALIGELLAAVGEAHQRRAMVRAVATTLATRMNVVRVELGTGQDRVIAQLDDGAWRCVEVATRGGGGVSLVPGLRVAARGPLPAFFALAGFRAALAEVVAVALRHLVVVAEVAASSQRAHHTARELRADLARAAERTVVARSPAMRALLERATLVARHATTVLLTGESGTGKEVIAREIHQRSPRRHLPMLHLNCAALPDALVESELFGHERGAFTGAERAHPGIFERAHRGTLFLDELGELAPAAQAKLLRVLQERQVRRLGGTVDLDVDVRLLAATNRPLAELVRDGRFRADLYHRLHVFALELPPLRDRPDDIGPLAASLLAELGTRLRMIPPALTPHLLARLAAHDWPGNVRELANVLETALILGDGRELVLPAEIALAAPRHRVPPFEASVRATLEAALRRTRGKLYGADGAAALLGLKPATLQSKMRKLGIDRRAFTA